MRIETALKAQRSLVNGYREAFESARHRGEAQSLLLEREARMRERVVRGRKVPRHVLEYARGYRDALRDAAHTHDLVYGGWYDGKLYTTHRGRADYYEKHGIEARDFGDDGRTTRRGFYWEAWVDKGDPRPFFVFVHEPEPEPANEPDKGSV